MVRVLQEIDPAQFIAILQPLLAKADVPGLVTALKANWTCDQVRALLRGPHRDARKVALLCLAWVGGPECLPVLSQTLRDPDPVVNSVCEHALWSIWFRGGCAEANQQLARGIQAMERREYQAAINHFNRAIRLEPTFSEAYNQRALAHYLCERYRESIADCRRTVSLMPCHFGAWAGMGHCFAHTGEIAAAVKCYETALELNPHMSCVREMLSELKAAAAPSSN